MPDTGKMGHLIVEGFHDEDQITCLRELLEHNMQVDDMLKRMFPDIKEYKFVSHPQPAIKVMRGRDQWYTLDL